ncbi:MAG: TonB-dependent receptor [Chitinophagaceae bacterium]|nr:TonB-dependent receptor [Chitinophagaceae bacterium]
MKEIRGKVTDSTGEVLPGASVTVKKTGQGTSASSDGTYSIKAADDDVLVISFSGYNSQEIPVGGRSTIEITLHKNVSDLADVVVMGYGSQKKATITGSVAVISGATIKTAPTTSLSNGLAGRLPGLTAVNSSGEPGGDGSLLRIRGSNTLGNNAPLIVLDGIVLSSSIDHLDQSDIESITVLKDASAAIYGARAANGVILIKTKRGARGKPTIDYIHNQGITMPTIVPKLADAPTFAQAMNEIDLYRNRAPRYTAEEIQKYRDGSDPWKYPNTDWYGETFKSSSNQTYDNLSMRGGSDNLSYFLSAGYKYQDAIYKNSATNYSQYNIRANLDGQVSKDIRVGVDLSGIQENSNYPVFGANDILFGLLRAFPTMPAYWPNGLPGPDIEYGVQPVLVTSDIGGYNRYRTFNAQGNAHIDVNIPWIKGLSFNGNASIFKKFYNAKQWKKPWYVYAWDYQTYDSNNEPLLVKAKKGYSDPSLNQSNENTQNITLNFLVNYEKQFGEHYLKFMAGTEKFTGDVYNFSAYRRYFVSTTLEQLFAGGDLEKNNAGSASTTARLNYFGRVNYNFLQKYLLEFVWRYDGSYIFPENKRFGFFQGVSVGWQIAQENFWKENIPAVNYLKLRASWGQTGNDLITPYQYLSTYGFGTFFPILGSWSLTPGYMTTSPYIFNQSIEAKTLTELRIPNPNVTWEVSQQANVGFDGQLFDGKVFFTVEYFHNVRNKILIKRNASVPSSTGLTLPEENIGKVSNRGLDFEIGYNGSANDFTYRVSINGGIAKNRIEYWDEAPGVPDYQKTTGHPMNSWLLYNAIGIFRDSAAVAKYPHWEGARPGDIIFEDVNGDGQINGLDMKRTYKNSIPTLTGGLNVSLGYKNFYLNMLWQGAAGAVQVRYVPSGDGWGNYLQEDLDGRWTPDNPDATKPRTWSRIDEYWMYAEASTNNTYWLRNSDYIRLKSAELGYNFSRKLYEKIGLSGLRIYLNGMNMLTIDKLKSSDPEALYFYGYPVNKVFNAGINVIL